jgi:hypothetical protein
MFQGEKEMGQLFFHVIAVVLPVNRGQSGMAEGDVVFQNLIHQKGLSDTPATIYRYKLGFFAIVNR